MGVIRMRVLIAEDELIERKAMRKFIEDNFSDIVVVGEAANGRNAIEQAQILQPDVIFMDIKMPGIDGLEAIERIHANDPSIKFIMISAYDSFAYAKKAMRFGIKDYILKPGKKEEVAKALLRAKKDIDAEKQREKERLQSELWQKEKFVEAIMQYPIASEAYALQKQLFPDMRCGFFFVFMPEVNEDVKRIATSIKKHVVHPSALMKREELVIVFVAATTAFKNDAILTLARQLYIDTGSRMYIGAGYPYASLKQLPSSYQEAYTACFQLKNAGKRPYGFLQKHHPAESVDNVIAAICHNLEKGNGHQAVVLFRNKQHLFRRQDQEDLYIRVKHLLDSRHIILPNRSLSSLTSRRDWEWFLDVCAMKINEANQSKRYVSQIKTYLSEHYDQDVTLEDAARSVDLSPNYFSHLFKKEFGETFIDYLTKLRLNKAREFIQKNRYSINEIISMIGYKDPNYFSRVFKKYYGESPRQFQKGILKK